MSKHIAVALALAGLLAGCGMQRTAEDRAEWVFGRAEKWIVKALEREEASDEQLARARAVLERHESQVTGDLVRLFDRHREVLAGVAGGGDTETLLGLEASLHETHVETLRSIGAMHQGLAEAVGEPTWQAASARTRERLFRHVR